MRSGALLVVLLSACGSSETQPAAPEPPATSRPEPNSSDPALPVRAPAEVPGADSAKTLAKIPALRRYHASAACRRGEAAGCIELAAIDADFAEILGGTIYGESGYPGLDAPAANARACELGGWQACAWIADRNRDGYCEEMRVESLSAPDAAAGLAHDKRAHALAEKACDAQDDDACVFVALRALEGCGRERDVAHGTARLDRALQIRAEKCRDGRRADCSRNNHVCGVAQRLATAPDPNAADPGTPANKATPVAVGRALASSVMPPWKGYRFAAAQLMDGDLTSSWQPLDKARGGVGQWFELRDLGGPGGTPRVSGIDIANGLQKIDRLGDLFLLNNRIARALLSFSDGSHVKVELPADKRGFHEIRFTPRATGWIRISVEAIHRGSKWNDLAVSEVRLWGAPTRAVASPRAPLCMAALETAKAGCEAGKVASCQDFSGHSIQDTEHFVAARKFIGEALGRHCDATDAASEKGRCREAADALGADATVERRRALYLKGCRLGDDLACGALGCHGTDDPIDESTWDEALGKPARAVCVAACERGDDASCLVLGGAKADYASSLALADPWVAQVSARWQARCVDGPSCFALGQTFETSHDGRTPLGIVDFLAGRSAYAKGCMLGSAPACDAVTVLIGFWDGGRDELVKFTEQGCKVGLLSACVERVNDGGAGAETMMKTTKKARMSACDAGDLAACGDAAAYVGQNSDEQSKILARFRQLLVQACDAGDAKRCGEAAKLAVDDAETQTLRKKAVQIAARECLQSGQCAALCDASRALGGEDKSFLGSDGLTLEELAPVTVLVPELNPEMLQTICRDDELHDPCSCGCC